VPTSRGGDNSIQTYGHEASDAQRVRAIATIQTYLNARATRNWLEACNKLAAKPHTELRQFAQGAGCAEAMESLAAQIPTHDLAEETHIEVLSFRVGGDYAFLIYRRPDHRIWATALTRERGKWKIISVTPNPLF
jgi:hypothetical protein